MVSLTIGRLATDVNVDTVRTASSHSWRGMMNSGRFVDVNLLGSVGRMTVIVTESTITCPACGFAKTETMPVDG